MSLAPFHVSATDFDVSSLPRLEVERFELLLPDGGIPSVLLEASNRSWLFIRAKVFCSTPFMV